MARPTAAWGSLPFAEQIAFFKGKLNLPTQTWQDLLGAAHDRAFVVAGAMRADLLADLHAAVLKGIERGTSLDEFRRDFDAIVSKRGWTGWTGEDTPGGRAWRQEIIYGTNMRTSYQAGRHAQAVAIAHRRPYWRWRHADTVAHPRPLHVAWDGKILRHDNPWWRSHWPPAGWNCFVPGTQVATPQGWRAIESLVRGDFVIGGSGNVQSVESTQISTFEGNIVRITSKQGNASATPNHRFLTLRGWIRAENLNIGDVLVQISEVSGLDNAISDINHTNTASGKFSVSVPRSRSKPGRMEALNTNIQLWNEDVNPIRKSTVVVDGVKSPFLDYIKHHLLNCGRLCAGIDMGGWVGFVHSKAGTCHLFSDFWSACRRTVFKFLRTTGNASVIVFCFPQAIMSAIRRLMKGCFPQNIGCLFTPSVVSYPLQLDALMGISRIDTEPFHQSHNRPHVAGPSVTKISDSHAFVDIEGSEGFASGSPLDKFDSLDGFVTWARMHGICSTITDIQRVQYNGNVYNLSITEDASYCLRLGVVHNCRCRVETLAERDLERMGKSGPDPTPDDGTYEWLDKAGNSHTIPHGIDPGWDYTPGATRDLIAEVKAKAAGLPEALGKALVEEVTATAERVADAFSLGVRDGSLYQNRTIRHGDDAARLAMQAHLGDVEAAALADYLGEGYKSVNRALNGLTPMTRMQADIFEGYQSALNQALDHLDRQPHAVLKRVMGGNQDEVNRFIDQLKAGMKTKSREVRIDSYMSTSGPTGTYTPGSVKARITIRAKPGSDQAGYVDGLSDFPAEDEVLYKAGSRFRVLKIAGGRGKPWEIELEEL